MPSQSRRTRYGGAPKSDKLTAEAVTPVPEAPAPQQEKPRGGILGWFQDAGDWVGEKYDTVTETVGNAIDTTKRVAGDVWDVVQATDVGYSDGKITVDTDLDEVMDLMPDSITDRIQLGEGAENKISLAYDTENKTLTASSKDLEIEGMDFEGLKSGNARVQDMSITVTNPGDAMAFLEGTREFLGDDQDGVAIDVSASKLDVENLQIPGEDGGTSISSLSVSDLKGSASNADGLPFGDQANASSTNFSAGSAQVDGITSGGSQIQSITASDLSGGLSERDETAYLQAASVQASGVTDATMTAGSLGADNVRVDIANEGGGLVFMDDKADHMKATVTASSATVGGMETMGANVEDASLGGLSLTADQDTSTLDLAAASFGGNNLRMGDNSLGGINASGLQAHVGGGDWSADLDSGRITNAELLGIQADSAAVSGLSAASTNGNTTGSADQFVLAGAQGDGWSLGQATINDLSGGMGSNGSMNANIGSLSASDASGFGTSVSQLEANQLAANNDGGNWSGSAASANLTGASGDGWKVGGAAITNASGSMSSTGAIDANVAHVVANNASGMGGSVDRLEASQLTAAKHGNGFEAGVNTASISGGSYEGHTVGSATVNDLNAIGGPQGTSATLESASVSDIAMAGGSTVNQLDVNLASLRQTDGGINADANSLSVSGVKTGDASIGSADASGVSARITDSATSLGVDQVNVSDLAAGGLTAQSLSASDTDVQLGENSMSATVANAQLTKGAMEGMGSVNSASITNLSGGMDGDKKYTEVGGLSFQGASHTGSGTTIDNGSLSGISGTSQGDHGHFRLANGQVNGVAGDSFSANQATIGGARLDTTASGMSGGVDSLNAKGLGFNMAPSTGPAPAGFDANKLISSASQRVYNANMNVSVPVQAGEYKTGVGLDVERDTRLDASMQIQRNQITDVNARFENPVDGPLWTSLRGLYDEDGKLKADVGGWFDQNLTKSVNESMGLGGKRLHSVGDYGTAIAGLPESGAGGSQQGKPSLSEAFDVGGMTANGSAKLSSGVIDTGNAQIDLARQNGANVFSGSARNGHIHASSDKILLDGTQANLDGSQVSTGGVEIDGAALSMDTAGRNEGAMSGTVEEIDLNDLRFKQ